MAADPFRSLSTLFPNFKPQDLPVEFSLLVNDEQTGKKHRIHAYRGTVKVVEPAKSWFDLQLISVYIIAIAAVAGIVYFLYTSYVISEEKSAAGGPKKFEKPAVVKQTGLQDEWIVSIRSTRVLVRIRHIVQRY